MWLQTHWLYFCRLATNSKILNRFLTDSLNSWRLRPSFCFIYFISMPILWRIDIFIKDSIFQLSLKTDSGQITQKSRLNQNWCCRYHKTSRKSGFPPPSTTSSPLLLFWMKPVSVTSWTIFITTQPVSKNRWRKPKDICICNAYNMLLGQEQWFLLGNRNILVQHIERHTSDWTDATASSRIQCFSDLSWTKSQSTIRQLSCLSSI